MLNIEKFSQFTILTIVMRKFVVKINNKKVIE